VSDHPSASDLADAIDATYDRVRDGDFDAALFVMKLGGLNILSADDIRDFSEAKKRLYHAFSSGKELSIPQMRAITGQDQADRRMRDLRADLEKRGWTITRRKTGKRFWLYKLTQQQGELL